MNRWITAPERRRGFTLVEVVVAVGVLALAVTGGVATLAVLARTAEDQLARTQAQRLGDAIAIELIARRTRLTAAGVDGLEVLAAAVPSAESAASLNFVVSRDGLKLVDEGTADLPPAEQFFLVELHRLGGLLAFDANAGALVVAAVVRWPYHVRTGTGDQDWSPGVMAPEARVTLCLAISR